MFQVFDPQFRKPYVNVNRWFVTLINQPNFKAVIGNFQLCSKAAQFDGKLKYMVLSGVWLFVAKGRCLEFMSVLALVSSALAEISGVYCYFSSCHLLPRLFCIQYETYIH